MGYGWLVLDVQQYRFPRVSVRRFLGTSVGYVHGNYVHSERPYANRT